MNFINMQLLAVQKSAVPPIAAELLRRSETTRCAIFGLISEAYLYSIISSAMESTPGDTSMNSSSRHGSNTVRDV